MLKENMVWRSLADRLRATWKKRRNLCAMQQWQVIWCNPYISMYFWYFFHFIRILSELSGVSAPCQEMDSDVQTMVPIAKIAGSPSIPSTKRTGNLGSVEQNTCECLGNRGSSNFVPVSLQIVLKIVRFFWEHWQTVLRTHSFLSSSASGVIHCTILYLFVLVRPKVWTQT